MFSRIALAASLLAATVSAHGNVTSPPARLPGPGMVQACGQTAVSAVLADGTLPLEDVTGALSTCQLNLCRGAVFQDNADQVQQFTIGQVVEIKVQIPIPHVGPANVSIVKTSTNSVLGPALIVFQTYADDSLPQLPPNNTDFKVTIPQLSSTDCVEPGDCVLQWFWFGSKVKQTYESCVDFVVVPGDNGASNGEGSGAGTSSTGSGSGVGSGSGSGTNSTGFGSGGSTTTSGGSTTGSGSNSGSDSGYGSTSGGSDSGYGSTSGGSDSGYGGTSSGSDSGYGSTGTDSGSDTDASPVAPLVTATPLADQPVDAFGGFVGRIPSDEVGPLNKRWSRIFGRI